MKAPKSLIWMSLLALLSCEPSEQEPVNPLDEELHPVTLSLQLKEEVVYFSGTKSIPPLDVPEPKAATRGEENESPTLKDLCCAIEYVVYKDGEDTPLKTETFTNEDLDFGIISDQLPRGVYKFVLVAHNKIATAQTSKTQMLFDEVSDTFYESFELEIEPGENNQENIILYRIVSKIEFISTDIVPDNAKEFTIQPDQYSFILDLFTGDGILSEDAPPLFTYPLDEYIGETGLTHSFFTFVPKEDYIFNVELKAIDIENEVLRTRTVENVEPIINRIIRYTGRLYNPSHSDDEFTITIDDDGKWGEPVENDLGD